MFVRLHYQCRVRLRRPPARLPYLLQGLIGSRPFQRDQSS